MNLRSFFRKPLNYLPQVVVVIIGVLLALKAENTFFAIVSLASSVCIAALYTIRTTLITNLVKKLFDAVTKRIGFDTLSIIALIGIMIAWFFVSTKVIIILIGMFFSAQALYLVYRHRARLKPILKKIGDYLVNNWFWVIAIGLTIVGIGFIVFFLGYRNILDFLIKTFTNKEVLIVIGIIILALILTYLIRKIITTTWYKNRVRGILNWRSYASTFLKIFLVLATLAILGGAFYLVVSSSSAQSGIQKRAEGWDKKDHKKIVRKNCEKYRSIHKKDCRLVVDYIEIQYNESVIIETAEDITLSIFCINCTPKTLLRRTDLFNYPGVRRDEVNYKLIYPDEYWFAPKREQVKNTLPATAKLLIYMTESTVNHLGSDKDKISIKKDTLSNGSIVYKYNEDE